MFIPKKKWNWFKTWLLALALVHFGKMFTKNMTFLAVDLLYLLFFKLEEKGFVKSNKKKTWLWLSLDPAF